MNSETVFGFDVGTGSLGIAVRRDMEMLRKESLLLPAEAGSLEELRTARRQYRTRLAHAAREAYWRKICEEAGIEVLHSRIPGNAALHIQPVPGDPRLEREFSAPGDDTIYTSCLLRIKLLQGEKLAGWQVFKAVRSAFQRRGFDPEVPWKNRSRSARENEENSDTAKKATEYEKLLRQYVNDREEYLYPCYFDAFRMGLWDAETNAIRLRPENPSERARGFTPPRKLVIAELMKLLENAAKLFPKLAGKTDEILFGPGREQYASFYAEKRKAMGLREGSPTDWNALLGQKIPRFDNRQPGYCALIPRLHVCQANDTAVIETTFLLKVKNLRFTAPEGCEVSLSPDAIRRMLELAREKAKTKRAELKEQGVTDKGEIQSGISSCYKILKKELKQCAKESGLEVLPGNDAVEAPKVSGRSRFSRPAAKIMRDLILSGESPRMMYDKLLKTPPADLAGGDLAKDLEFLLVMPDSWDAVCVPDMGLVKIQRGAADVDAAVAALIAEQRSPLIRLRLKLFDEQLKKLIADPEIGKPDRIVIEFVRTDFIGEEQKRKLDQQMKQRRRDNENIRKEAEAFGYFSDTELLKLKLLKEQANICPYTGDTLSPNDLDALEIDHIVPRHGGKNGSDGYTNKVVTKRTTNEEKGPRTPYEYLHGSGKWTAYTNRVMKMKLSKRKQRLLLSPDAEKLDQKYADLCSTAWIARIFRDIAMLRCNWRDGAAGEARHVVVINGSVTASLRRRYHIDALLAPDCHDADAIEKKNRADKRHHALDAMVLTFATFWMRDPALRDKLTLPDKVDRNYFAKYIDSIVPRNIILPKPKLELMIYGKRKLTDDLRDAKGEIGMTKRESIFSLGLNTKGKFDPKTASKNFSNICDKQLRDFMNSFFEKSEIKDTETWKKWCESLCSPDTGMPIKKVRIWVGSPDEYKNLSRDGDVFRGQYRKGDMNRGCFIYLDAKGKARRAPVYAHSSVYMVRKSLLEQGFVIVDFFQSGCNVELKNEVIGKSYRIMPGIYRLDTIKENNGSWSMELSKNAQKYLLSPSAIPDIANNLKRC